MLQISSLYVYNRSEKDLFIKILSNKLRDVYFIQKPKASIKPKSVVKFDFISNTNHVLKIFGSFSCDVGKIKASELIKTDFFLDNLLVDRSGDYFFRY